MQLPVPGLPVHRLPGPGILDVPEDTTDFEDNHVQLLGTSGPELPGQHGQHIYTEYQSLGGDGQHPLAHSRQPLVYVPQAGPDGLRVPVVRLDQDPVPGFPLSFAENDTGIPQQALTQTTISWRPLQHSAAYVVSCYPTNLEEKMFQVSVLASQNLHLRTSPFLHEGCEPLENIGKHCSESSAWTSDPIVFQMDSTVDI